MMLLLVPFFLLSGATSIPLNNNRLTVDCTGTVYASNTPYQTNLNTLLTSLASESSSTNYNNATVGIGTNRIYGLFLCEGDLSHTECQTCVQTATSNITAPESCPFSRQAIIWYDYCMVRYSDTNFFGVVDSNGFNMTNPDTYTNSPVPHELVAHLVQEAPFQRPMFAYNESTSMNLYAMAECTDDLTSAGCSQCLTAILSNIKLCCTHSRGWRYLSASCWIRYEETPFLRNLGSTFIQVVTSTCSADSLPSSNSLNTLLSDITSKAAPTGFYNDSQNQLYGLALCRGDIPIPSDDCSSCLTQARSTLMTEYCPNSTRGTVWYEKCMVRYSNVSFFGNVDYNGKYYCGVEKVSNDTGDATIAFATGLLGVAANSKLMFAAKETGVGGSQPRYVLVQCTRDLSSVSCERCLQKGMSVVSTACRQTNGWRYLSGSCNIRYENFSFCDTPAIEIGESATPPESPGAGGDENKRSQLDWARRRLIIAGIARGLLYLHEDSLLKVIHRDLKASNVLLDNAMNPKISDFGMSKIFRTDETEVNTAITKIFGTDETEVKTDRVVGTIGYISPEYALDGIFSEKSDVYSFGVLLLEILSGQKNGHSHFEQHGQTLLRRAWQLWLVNRATELVDRLLGDSYILAEAIKFIHIGLLCVQENAEERPTMSLVVVMLRSEQMVLPEPTEPPTFSRQRTSESDLNYTTTPTSTKGRSTNQVTISDVTPR